MTPDQELKRLKRLLLEGPPGGVVSMPIKEGTPNWAELRERRVMRETRNTSREAYTRIRLTAGKCRRLVLEMLRANPNGLTHDQIIANLGIRYSSSGLRTRTSELVKVGLVKADTRYGKSLLGNRATIWKVTEAGAAWAPTDGDPAAPK